VHARPLGHAAPPGALAVEHAHHAAALVQVPDLEQAAEERNERRKESAPPPAKIDRIFFGISTEGHRR
jgi:hypothetical protein